VNARLLRMALEREPDIVLIRKRARRLAELLGFDRQDQTRITTAVSELARNAFEYAGGGRAEFRVSDEGRSRALEIIISDQGPGIADVDAVLSGNQPSEKGMGVGLRGAQRLMDDFQIESEPGLGTMVRVVKSLPARAPAVNRALVTHIGQALATDEPADPVDEIRRQNQEIMAQLQELQDRQEALGRLNQELQDTNRGVVALYAELDERANHLRRADELKSKFLSHMSHEFRTPLNSVLALSRLLLARTDGDLTAEQEKQVQFIRKAAESLTELVDDLLDFAKVEAGKTVVTPVEFAAEDLFGALRGMLRPLLVADAVALIFENAADLPQLCTDEGKVSQILRNFLSNAIKFTERGEVRVWATADSDADTFTFHVRDTGIGIAEADLGIIFEEFGQVIHPLQSRFRGTGLGLPLSKKLAELLGGAIAVQSAPGQGSVFSVTIPRLYRATEGIEATDEDWVVDPGRTPVLVVEDNPADSFAIQRLLAGSRYQPIIAPTVASAKRTLDRVRPTAVLLDILLFGDESWRMILGLRQEEATGSIPIVVISSTGEERKALGLGADSYLSKPIDRRQLIEILDRLTGNRSITRVLLVDDEEVTRYLVRQLLPRGLYDVRAATTGSEGWAQLVNEPPDVLLLDLTMPEMTGFELLDRISGDASLDAVPAIVLTSAILTLAERQRLRRAARIMSKSDLSGSALTGVIADVLKGLPSEGYEGRASPVSGSFHDDEPALGHMPPVRPACRGSSERLRSDRDIQRRKPT
jgi:signal transduction histidine kinase/DNA-binding response OmpR family regulator